MTSAVDVKKAPQDGQTAGQITNLENVKVLLRPMTKDTLLLRLQNMDEKKSSVVELSGVLGRYKSVEELSLSANQKKQDMLQNKMNWNGMKLNDPSLLNTDFKDDGKVSLRPLEIRTFEVSL
jgi:hypothetical protein